MLIKMRKYRECDTLTFFLNEHFTPKKEGIIERKRNPFIPFNNMSKDKRRE